MTTTGWRVRRAVVVRREDPALRRANAEHVEVVSARDSRLGPRRCAVAVRRSARVSLIGTVTSLIAASAANEVFVSRRVVYSLYVCFDRCPDATAAAGQDLRDLFRALGGQRREEQGVDAAEDRRVPENANRQRQHGDDREAWCARTSVRTAYRRSCASVEKNVKRR